MLEPLAKYVGGRVLTILVVFGCACAGYWFYKHPEDLTAIWHAVKLTLVWLGFVLLLPWATFFVTRKVVAVDSNQAAALMLVGYLGADMLVGLWLAGGVRGHNALAWMVLVVGFLAAGVYNFMACEYQAERLEGF